MKIKDEKILVTGAGGFIGSHLTEKLVKEGAKVKAFVRYNSRNDFGMLEMLPARIRKNIEIIAGDLRDTDAVRKAVKGCNLIFHLGALIGIPYSYFHPREVVETNVLGTLNVLSACRETGIEKVIHTSTSEVYGTAIEIPITEEHPLQGQSPYSASKIGADKIAESFYLSFGLPVAIIRPFNTYGPRQSPRAIIPAIIIQALKSKKVCLGALSPIRDFTYVKDTVEAFVKMGEADRTIGKVINVGSNECISTGELVKKIGLLINKKIEVIVEKRRIRPENSEVGRLIADNKKAKDLLQWAPRTSLEKGLKITIDWFKKNLHSYKNDIYYI